ncbi:MAG: prepilin-type N-terminal cleavage/methylation domain-containing protein, partial [Planctomycetota bacterium]|nr:prepilin-type N-terminal cleavage/methylation domain-containing protein [Planctomycetota bacterium]
MTSPASHHRAARRARSGFSLIELLLAIFILGVGVISVAAVFPAGIIQQRRAQDDIFGPVVAESALSVIRSRVSQDDFGTFEEFGLFGAGDFGSLDSWLSAGDAYTQPGDWPWMRPSMAAVPTDASPDAAPYAGDLDLFSARAARESGFAPDLYQGNESPDDPAEATGVLPWENAWLTTEFVDGVLGRCQPARRDDCGRDFLTGEAFVDPGAFLFGIPFNRAKFDLFGSGQDPLVTITQEERFWPSGSGFVGQGPRPQYVWDCMFRRFQGRVYVGIFVYRIKAGNATGGYAVSQDAAGLGTPPLPARVDFPIAVNGTAYRPLNTLGGDTTGDVIDREDADRNLVRNTAPGNPGGGVPYTLDPYLEGWQAPGQWLLDHYGRTHRVLQGRVNREQGPVRLSRPVPSQSPSTALYNPAAVDGGWDGNILDWQRAVDEVRSIWFVPPSDRRGITLTPVYMTVREL